MVNILEHNCVTKAIEMEIYMARQDDDLHSTENSCYRILSLNQSIKRLQGYKSNVKSILARQVCGLSSSNSVLS